MPTLSLRLTHGYVGTYAHLDKWRDVGSFTEIARHQREQSEAEQEDPCDPRVFDVFIKVQPYEGVTDEEIEKAIYSEFSRHGCAHEWDCCGCWSHHASKLVKIGSTTENETYYKFEIHASRNY